MNTQKKRIKILIADDEECIREFLSYMLEKEGFVAEGAADGKEALEKIALDKPDIIILDVVMPRMDGLEVCKRLRENPDTRGIPIIFFSAQVRVDSVLQDLPGAAIKYIKKPGEMEYLLAQIEELVG
jgi:DNA-binding response OmpR family regulator